MEKKRLAIASFEKQKYFFEPQYKTLPKEIQEEIQVLCVLTAQKLGCTFGMGWESDGNIYFEIIPPENSIDFDDIGAELEIKEIRRTKIELLKALRLWYLIFQTNEGQEIAQEILKEKSE